jgi:hypothetical protein
MLKRSTVRYWNLKRQECTSVSGRLWRYWPRGEQVELAFQWIWSYHDSGRSGGLESEKFLSVGAQSCPEVLGVQILPWIVHEFSWLDRDFTPCSNFLTVFIPVMFWLRQSWIHLSREFPEVFIFHFPEVSRIPKIPKIPKFSMGYAAMQRGAHPAGCWGRPRGCHGAMLEMMGNR